MSLSEKKVSSTPVCGECCTRLENVGVSFGKNEILQGVNLHFHCGQIAAVIGPNGGGKTTLLRAILGEIPHTGTICNRLSSVKGYKKLTIGYVPQKLDLDQSSPLSVLDLFIVSRSRRPAWTGCSCAVKNETRHALALTGADHLMGERAGTLSGGQLQRVLLALALTPLPDLLLLDEPVSGIDPQGTGSFYKMVSDLRRQYHLAIVLVSHDCAAAAQIADRMLYVNKTVHCDGRPEDVLNSKVVIDTFGRIVFNNSIAMSEPRQEQED